MEEMEKMEKMNKDKTVIITVSGGLADIYYSPLETNVIIVDYDSFEEGNNGDCPICFYPMIENGNSYRCSYCGFDIDEEICEQIFE
jgi:tRNA(Ile2) C34 agmatinyltransferase TiaS